MNNSEEVLDKLDLSKTDSKLLSILTNLRGAQEAVKHKMVDYLRYPFSISENF